MINFLYMLGDLTSVQKENQDTFCYTPTSLSLSGGEQCDPLLLFNFKLFSLVKLRHSSEYQQQSMHRFGQQYTSKIRCGEANFPKGIKYTVIPNNDTQNKYNSTIIQEIKINIQKESPISSTIKTLILPRRLTSVSQLSPR